MSSRNTQDAKRAARERLRAERERQAKKDKARRQLVVGASVVGVLAVAAGIGYGVMKMNEPTGWEAAKDKKLVKPAHATTGKDGSIIRVGRPSAKKTVDVYEDLRCPACASFEQTVGSQMAQGAEQGKYQLRVHLGDIIDNGPAGGEGSKNAASALGAALNVSEKAYLDYHRKLYSAQYHPDETQDKYSGDAYLLKIADTVPELKGNKSFQKAVKNGTYDKWTLSAVSSFNKAGINQTPTVKVNGKKVSQQKVPAELAKMGVDLGGKKGGSGKSSGTTPQQ